VKTPLAGRNAMSRIRVLLIATCIIAVTPRLSGNIILVSRLSDSNSPGQPTDSQTGFLPAHLCNQGFFFFAMGVSFGGSSTSNSSILINSPTEGLRVEGDGTAYAAASRASATASAKLIVLSFTLTDVSYPYSITGQLNGALCSPPLCAEAKAKLASETGTIFERIGTALSESGTLPPGNYTLSVDVSASVSTSASAGANSDANFTFALEGPMSTPAPTPTATPVTRATNLSTRLLIGTGDDAGIGGFIITGDGPRHLLLRGIGPSLSGIMTNALPDPWLQLNRRCLPAITSNNWRDAQEAEIIATGRAPSNDLESAIVADLLPGSYTAVLKGNESNTGVGLVEIYDLSTNQESRLANISTRAKVGTGNDIVIAGVILGGSSEADTIILRGLGPSVGVNLPLLDPKLELRDSEGALIASNDNWRDDDPNQAAIIQAAGLAPRNGLESAIAATLMPGEYTALLSGMANSIGTGLIEIYDNPTIGPTASPTVIPGPTPYPTPTPVPAPTATPGSYLVFGGFSTRLKVETDINVSTTRFAIRGFQSKKFIVRALGPSLAVPGMLADPYLELRDSSGYLIRANDDWRTGGQEQAIIDSSLSPPNDKESAIVVSLPGNTNSYNTSYTATISGVNHGAGLGSLEVYDIDYRGSTRLNEVSTRGVVQTGNDVMIAGTTVLGSTTRHLLIRALGPSLSYSNPLANPYLELRDSYGTLIGANDDWRTGGQEQEIISSGNAPPNDAESAIAEYLPAEGAIYTAIVSGVNNTTGVASLDILPFPEVEANENTNEHNY
jgi:hypothetical protein